MPGLYKASPLSSLGLFFLLYSFVLPPIAIIIIQYNWSRGKGRELVAATWIN